MQVGYSVQMTPALKRLLGPRFPAALMRGLNAATSSVMWKILQHHQGKQMRPYAGTPSPVGMLNIRTGRLAQSLKVKVRQNKSKGTVTGEYGTRDKRMSVLENGKRIFGRPWLTVPLHDNLPSARAMRATGNTFVRKSRSGHLIIWRRRGSINPEPMYVLKRSVKPKARRTMKTAYRAKKKHGVREITTAVRLMLSRGF